MKRITIILICYLLINRCCAIGLTDPVGGRTAALGGTSVCERSVWSLQNNPAGLAFLNGWHLGMYYENRWLLRETAFKCIGVAKSIPDIGCFGLSVSQYGYSRFNENKFGLAYARDFGPYLQIGLQANWLLLHHGEGYADRHLPAFELGVQSQVTEKLLLGAYLFNLSLMRFGLAYQLADNFIGQLEIEKNLKRSGVRLGAGIEYHLFERISLRAGAQYNPNIISFGVGYVIKEIRVDVAAQMHQTLGASLQISVEYHIP